MRSLPADAKLFDAARILTRSCKKGTEEETLRSLAPRLHTRYPHEEDLGQILLECDEVAACLDRDDEKQLKKEKERFYDEMLQHAHFKSEFEKARKAINPKAKAKATGKSAASSSSHISLDKERLAMAEQSELKHLVPPGGYIWKSRNDSSWHVRVPPLSSRSRTVRKPDSVHWLVCRAWEDYARLNGKNIADLGLDGYVPEV